jgi:predicted ATPase
LPFLKKIAFNWNRNNREEMNRYPFNVPALQGVNSLNMDHNVVFLIGENGTGKSTLLEALACKCGFGLKGGSKNNLFEEDNHITQLASIMTVSWLPKVNNGFFMRAETFFDFAGYLDEMAKEEGEIMFQAYGGKSLNKQSHGEAFLSLFNNRFNSKGIYLLDEPEAALSPQRQLAFLRIIWQLEHEGKAQFIIATHSPILMAYPDAVIYSFDNEKVERVAYEGTGHYQLTKAFLQNREIFFRELFVDS